MRLNYLASKSVFVIKLACANLVLKRSVANLLNSGVSIYLSWLWFLNLFSVSVIFVLQLVFSTKLLTLGLLFSAVVNTVLAAKLLISGILFSNSVILTLQLVY